MLLLLSLYLTLLIVIGMAASLQAGQVKNFYLAGQKAGILRVTFSLCATILGSSAILGTLSLTRKTGWAAGWMMLCAAAGLLGLVPLVKFVHRYGRFTLPDLLEKFYGKELRLLSCALIPIAWTGVIAAQIIGGGKIIDLASSLTYTQGAVLCGVCFTLYTFLGGQVSILKTDSWQALLIFIGIAAALYAGLQIAGPPSWQEIRAGFPFNAQFSGLDLFILLITYGSLFLVGPDIYSRIFCAKNEKTAAISVFLTALIIAPLGLVLAFIGITANLNTFDFLTRGITPYLLVAGLLSAVLSSADTTLLTAATILTQLFRDINDPAAIKMTRLLILVFGILATFIALMLTSIIESLLLAYSFFSGAFIIPIIAGLLGYRVSKVRVISACLAGGGLALAGKLWGFFSAGSGNILIIAAFIINAGILFIRPKTKDQ